MIPRIQSIDDIDISGARWVFIIEKEVCLSPQTLLSQSECWLTGFAIEGRLPPTSSKQLSQAGHHG